MPGFPAALRTLKRSLSALPRPRGLSDSELRFLAQEFGASLDAKTIKLAGGGHPFGRGAWQPVGALMQLQDAWFEEGDARNPLRTEAYPMFAHEALHIWQRRHGHSRVSVSVDGLWLGVTQGRSAYAYDTRLDDPEQLLAHFRSGNIEQQGQILQDYVQSNIADPEARLAKFASVAQYVKSSGRSLG